MWIEYEVATMNTYQEDIALEDRMIDRLQENRMIGKKEAAFLHKWVHQDDALF